MVSSIKRSRGNDVKPKDAHFEGELPQSLHMTSLKEILMRMEIQMYEERAYILDVYDFIQAGDEYD